MMKIFKNIMEEKEPAFSYWDKPTVRLFEGVKVKGRPTRGFGESKFEYAGKVYTPEPWTEKMMKIKLFAEDIMITKFNKKVEFTFCLCGLYETGEVSIPHHSDTVPTLNDYVLGVSFGAPRLLEWIKYDYQIKKRINTSEINLLYGDKYLTKEQHLLEDGDVFVFDGYSQMNTTHAIPPIRKIGKRISLTFRTGL